MTRITLLAAVALFTVACKRDRAATGTPAAAADTATPTHIDSVVPREVAIERFREGTTKVDSLSGGERSRDKLVKAWVKAIETSDTARLREMRLNKDEFAWLYYPTAAQGLPPYDLSPGLLWFMLDGQSDKSRRRILSERGGQKIHLLNYSCDPQPAKEGENTIWGPCELRQLRAPGDTISERLFGLLIERDGIWKFVSYKGRYD